MTNVAQKRLFGSVIRAHETERWKAEEHEYATGLRAAPHVHGHTYVSIIMAGALVERFGRRSEELRAAQMMVMPAGERHSNVYRAPTRALHVEVDAFVSDVAAVGGSFAPGPRRDARAATLGALIVDEFRRNDAASSLAIEGLLSALLARSTSKPPTRTAPPWLRRVTELLRDRVADRLPLRALAETAGVHPVHLSREFHRHMGRTIGHYLRELRIARACELLAAGEQSLADVALECGFCDQSHFTAAFRQVTGMTPARYRSLRAR